MFMDLKKAFDSVDRVKLFRILRERCTNQIEEHVVRCIERLFDTNTMKF